MHGKAMGSMGYAVDAMSSHTPQNADGRPG